VRDFPNLSFRNEGGEEPMKKAVYLLIILLVAIGGPMVVAQTDKDCPDCPKPQTSMPLDAQWQKFTSPPLAPGELPDCHRVQFGKQDCGECHKKETPAGYNAWLTSKHGLNMVKCGTCHGDANNYRARPDKVVCIGCHSQQVHNMPDEAPVTNCSYCHKGHWFTVHKVKLYERFAPGQEKRFNVPGF
jgi:hypothetical protein